MLYYRSIHKTFFLLITTLSICLFSKTYTNNFETLDEAKIYASYYPEYPDIDNDNWLNPDYTSFYKKNIPGWFGNIMRFVGIYRKPMFPMATFNLLLKKVVNNRENNGLMGRFVQKLNPESKSSIIIFGDLYASFHSLIRDLDALKEKEILNNHYKLKENHYIIFNGNAINLSPYSLETLMIILRLMEKNPNQVFYVRGTQEDKEHWENFSLKKELELRTPDLSTKLIKRFFRTLPLALYLIGKEGKKSEIIRISNFDRNFIDLNEDDFADFLILNDEAKTAIRNLSQKTTSPTSIDIKVIVKTEDRLVKQTQTEGLVQTDSDKGATSWLVLSAPNRTFRSLYKFFYDAFAVITTDGKIDNWTIALYNEDVREPIGIKKRIEFNLVSGDQISLETKESKLLKNEIEKLKDDLKSCQQGFASCKAKAQEEKKEKESTKPAPAQTPAPIEKKEEEPAKPTPVTAPAPTSTPAPTEKKEEEPAKPTPVSTTATTPTPAQTEKKEEEPAKSTQAPEPQIAPEIEKEKAEIAKKEAEIEQKEAELAKKEAELKTKKTTPPAEETIEEIVVGTTMGLTGNIKEESESIRLGLQLRIDKINKAGGINGKKIRLIVLDDGYNPNRARENVIELIEKHKVNIIIFPVGSATTKAYLDLVREKKVVVLFTSSGSPALRNPTPEYFIHFRPSYPAMGEALIDYAQKTFDAKRFALVTQQDVTASGVVELLKQAGVTEDNYIEVSHKRNITDMSKQAETIKKFKPDAIIFWTTSSASMAIIKALGAENLIGIKMVGADLRNPRFNAFLKSMGLSENYIDAQALPNPATSPIEILEEYRAALGGKPVDGLSAEAYICASIFIYLLKQTNGSTNKEEIIKAAEAIKNLDMGGIKLDFEPKDRRLSRFIWLSTGAKDWEAIDIRAMEQEREKKAEEEKKKKEVAAEKKQEEVEEKQQQQEKEETKEGDFIIGTTLDKSKGLATEGKNMEIGLNAYIRKLNREGGVKGRKVKLIVLDDGYSGEQAKKNVEMLIEKYHTNIILSSLGSPTTAAYLDSHIKPNKVLVSFPFTGSPVLRDPSFSHILHLTPPYDQIELALFRYAIDKLKAKKFAFFAQADEVTAGVKQIIAAAGIEKEDHIFLGYEANTTDFSKQIKAVEDFKPNAIALLSTPRAAEAFLRQLGVDKMVGKKLLGIQLGDVKFKEFLKEQGLTNQFFDVQTVPNPDSDLEILKEYRKEIGNKKPDSFSAVAYIAAAIFFDLVKQVEGPITNEKIIAIAEKTDKDFKGLKLHFEPSSRTILNYIWFDTGTSNWEQVEVQPKKIEAK